VAIVGSEPDEELIRIGAAIPGVIVTGSVMDVKPWLWSSKVSIVPLQVGGGIRLKIYEAMAASLPIVSTSIGAEGLMISPGKDILIADTPEEFACQLVRLLDNPRFRDEIARAGHEMVRDSFSWDRVAEAVDSILAY
jgi:glycosyltransferase involved in cell wall biosynthesis